MLTQKSKISEKFKKLRSSKESNGSDHSVVSAVSIDSGTSSPRTEDTFEDTPFRGRAQTDGHLHKKPWRWHSPAVQNPTSTTSKTSYTLSEMQELYPTHYRRRMSISMRGNNASC